MEYLIIVIVIVALALMAGGVMLLRSRQRPGRIAAPPEAPPAPPAPPRAGEDGGAAPPARDTLVTEAPAAEPVEAPQPLAGRMTRLRGRLARSQTGFGSVLLGLLSRDGLDDQGWEE